MAPPYAYTPISVEGMMRRCADDFLVDESAAFAPSGEGEHLLLYVEKRGLNTYDVAHDLACSFGVAPTDVGFAGMKDRHAMTRQWFSVHTQRDAPHVEASPAWRILESARHQRKLRRGDLAGNAFRIRVRDLSGDVAVVSERLDVLKRCGAPNYYGEQRFGHDGANVDRAKRWICNRPRPAISAFRRGLHLSTARALLFNAVLAARVSARSWNRLIDGDVALDALPTGPLWGRGRGAARGMAHAIETDAMAAYRDWLDPLEHLGLSQQRRPLVLRPGALEWTIEGSDLELRFDLLPGQYATTLLRELGRLHNAAAWVP